MHASLILGKQNGQYLVLSSEQTSEHLLRLRFSRRIYGLVSFSIWNPLVVYILYKTFKIMGLHRVNSEIPMVSYAPSSCAVINLILHQPPAMLET
jgi:hypothetical protein